MLQLIIDGVEMPESQKGGYKADRVELSTDVVMISGRLTREVRGSVWQIEYSYGYLTDAERVAVLTACEHGLREPISVGFLPPDSTGEELTYSTFLVTGLQRPTFYWSSVFGDEEDVPVARGIWAGFSVTLREVSPSD